MKVKIYVISGSTIAFKILDAADLQFLPPEMVLGMRQNLS